MSAPSPPPQAWSLGAKQRVDAVCLRFEDAWQSGTPPALDQFLGELEAADQPLLFQELLALDLTYRLRRGETPRPEEYTSRFPEHATLVEPVFREVTPPAREPVTAALETYEVGGGAPTMREHAAPVGGPFPQVPGYEILSVLGRGGMGVVYQARQLQPARVVALKVIRAGAHASPEELIRFRGEAEALARLRHPGVVQVYEVGDHAGQPYFSMEFVPGGSLAARLAGQPLEPRLAALIAEKLALVVHAIHQAGVIHRDLKPANVLLEGGLDVPLERCTPRVSDFGLAKQLDDQASPSRPDQALGTPEYMAPEQAAPKIAPAGAWTDVHGLGTILYQLLTGRPPFQGDTNWEVIKQVLQHEPTFPRPRSRLERDLHTICRKCLDKKPPQRYGSAAEVAERLRRVLEDRPIPERPPNWAERIGRVLRRHPLAVGLVLVAFGAGGGIWGFAAVSAYLSHPDRVREGIESRLRNDEEVTLIGATGPPGYFQWRAGETSSLISSAANRPFSVFATEIALIEFPYAAGLKHYRLRAEVRHDMSPGITLIGLYAGRHQYGIRKGVERSSFVCLSFCDRGTLPRDAKKNRVSKASLDYYYFEPRAEQVHPRWPVPKPLPYAVDFPIENPAPWRELVLEVSPDKVRAFWGEEPGRLKEVTTITIPDLLTQARLTLPEMDRVVKELTTREGVALDFSTRGGIRALRPAWHCVLPKCCPGADYRQAVIFEEVPTMSIIAIDNATPTIVTSTTPPTATVAAAGRACVTPDVGQVPNVSILCRIVGGGTGGGDLTQKLSLSKVDEDSVFSWNFTFYGVKLPAHCGHLTMLAMLQNADTGVVLDSTSTNIFFT